MFDANSKIKSSTKHQWSNYIVRVYETELWNAQRFSFHSCQCRDWLTRGKHARLQGRRLEKRPTDKEMAICGTSPHRRKNCHSPPCVHLKVILPEHVRHSLSFCTFPTRLSTQVQRACQLEQPWTFPDAPSMKLFVYLSKTILRILDQIGAHFSELLIQLPTGSSYDFHLECRRMRDTVREYQPIWNVCCSQVDTEPAICLQLLDYIINWADPMSTFVPFRHAWQQPSSCRFSLFEQTN